MAKELKDGVWILTRDAETPDSDRYVERDDPIYTDLKELFDGHVTHLDFNKIIRDKNMRPEDVFIDLHENYGYICIGTGENPAINEGLSSEEKIKRQANIEKLLEQENLPHILVKGKYMGVEEYSYFIPFHHRNRSLANVLQSETLQKVVKIAEQYHQDSLLVCQNGYSCYLYTSGPQKGNVVAGRTAVVYPEKASLPDDCYSLFIRPDNRASIGFTCALNFTRVYDNVAEFAAEENKMLQKHYQDFDTTWNDTDDHTASRKKVVVLLRGRDGYNNYAVNLKNALMDAGLKAAIFGTDANIAKINEEVSGWSWPQIRTEFLQRNQKIYHDLMNQNDIDVIVYADMNKLAEFMQPYVEEAQANGNNVLVHVVNSFVFDPRRSEYVEKICNQYGAYMTRHVADFRNEQSQIHADHLNFGEAKVHQLHDQSPIDLADTIKKELISLRSQSDLSYRQSASIFNHGENNQVSCEIKQPASLPGLK
ncbi:MAG TPA: hypothetical protein VL360_08400 [Gammaproteobacteria bacterium]|jgi:hypothetical protein|nr:hypothetical protein [Gammaproteobacteria bacterium]